ARRRIPLRVDRAALRRAFAVHVGAAALDAVDAAYRPVAQPHRGERPSPDAAGVDRQQVGAIEPAERGPVAEHDRRAGARAIRCVEPGYVAGGGAVDAFLGAELHAPVRRAEADAR